MEVREELLTIGEIAIGIAGFSGIMAAFLQRGGLDPADRSRFVNLFTASFSTLFLAFVPIVVSHLVAESDRIWAWSSGVMIFAWVFNTAIGIRALPDIKTRVVGQSRLPRLLVGIPSMINLGVQVSNVGGWFWAPGFLAYLFGLFVYIYASGLLFVFVVLYRPDDETGA